jgi:hypothetical protein
MAPIQALAGDEPSLELLSQWLQSRETLLCLPPQPFLGAFFVHWGGDARAPIVRSPISGFVLVPREEEAVAQARGAVDALMCRLPEVPLLLHEAIAAIAELAAVCPWYAPLFARHFGLLVAVADNDLVRPVLHFLCVVTVIDSHFALSEVQLHMLARCVTHRDYAILMHRISGNAGAASESRLFVV